MSMILPYYEMASAAALAQASVCASRTAAGPLGEPTPLCLGACGATSSPVHKPSRWARVVGAVLAPISGPTLSPPRSGASNI